MNCENLIVQVFLKKLQTLNGLAEKKHKKVK